MEETIRDVAELIASNLKTSEHFAYIGDNEMATLYRGKADGATQALDTMTCGSWMCERITERTYRLFDDWNANEVTVMV